MQQGKQAVSRNSVVGCKKMRDAGTEKDTYDSFVPVALRILELRHSTGVDADF